MFAKRTVLKREKSNNHDTNNETGINTRHNFHIIHGNSCLETIDIHTETFNLRQYVRIHSAPSPTPDAFANSVGTGRAKQM